MKKLVSFVFSLSLLVACAIPSLAQWRSGIKGLKTVRTLRTSTRIQEVKFVDLTLVSRQLLESSKFRSKLAKSPTKVDPTVYASMPTVTRWGKNLPLENISLNTVGKFVLEQFPQNRPLLTPQDWMIWARDAMGIIQDTSFVPEIQQIQTLRQTLQDVALAGPEPATIFALQEEAFMDFVSVSEPEQAVALMKEFSKKVYYSRLDEADKTILTACLVLGEPGITYLREFAAQRQKEGFVVSACWGSEAVQALIPDIKLRISSSGPMITKEEVETSKTTRERIQKKVDEAKRIAEQKAAEQEAAKQAAKEEVKDRIWRAATWVGIAGHIQTPPPPTTKDDNQTDIQ